jgi:hypothetical protein
VQESLADAIAAVEVGAASPPAPASAPAPQSDPNPSAVRIVVAGGGSEDPELLAAVRQDWTNLAERSVRLTELDLEQEADEIELDTPAEEPPAAAPLAVVAPARSPEPSRIPPATRRTPAASPRLAQTSARALSGIREQVQRDRALIWAARGTAALLLVAGAFGLGAVLLRPGPRKLPPVQASAELAEPQSTAAAQAAAKPRIQSEPRAEAPQESAAPTPAAPPEPAAPRKIYRVNINALPYADIEIDGKWAGQTPMGNYPIEEGRHMFRVKMSTGEVQEVPIDIGEDGQRIVFD